MLFNSLTFFLFLPTVFCLFWVLGKNSTKRQNLILLLASYTFYGWWDYRFLSLIVVSTLVDFFVGKAIYKAVDQKRKKRLLWTSIVFNIGLLGFFKYFDFFTGSLIEGLSTIGLEVSNTFTLTIILPVGISFYTFQTLSYSLDVYREKLKPTNNLLAFATYVAFFPQLVAGPIERAVNLLPQIVGTKKFKYSQGVEGLQLMLWGLFKKVAIADALAPMVDDIFLNYGSFSSVTLLMGAVFFGVQIYCDFSGYSDIAIGTAKLFGIDLMSNFKFPYFSRNIGEFWRRWHISLSTWFRDYLYIPLGGSRCKKQLAIRNIFIIFLVSGLWHGANWTFLAWGAFHALLFLPSFVVGNNRKFTAGLHLFTSLKTFLVDSSRIVVTFFLVTIGWVFFRSETISASLGYLKAMFSCFEVEFYVHPQGYRMVDYFLLLAVFVVYEYVIRADERNPFPFSKYTRFACYLLLILGLIMFYDDGVDRSFIYFQF